MIKRIDLQNKINVWHRENQSNYDFQEYKEFLVDIGYLIEEKEDFSIETENVDAEIAKIAGPQLVVPVDNARYALNAANARWGSLYDALYGTDAIPGEIGKDYNEDRGNKVIKFTREFLDNTFPIRDASWKKITKIKINEKNLIFQVNEVNYNLKDNSQFVGYTGDDENISSL